MNYVYTDEDNAPMNDFDVHNPTVYTSVYEARMIDRYGELEPKGEKENGCWNCKEYDGSHCMKNWDNLDPSYYVPDRDDKEPDDCCDDYENDPDVSWKEFYGGNEP